MRESATLQLNKDDVLSILRGALLAAGGTAATYLSTLVIPDIDDSTLTGAILAGMSATMLNVLRKVLSGAGIR